MKTTRDREDLRSCLQSSLQSKLHSGLQSGMQRGVQSERGATMIEYALLACLICLTAIAGVTTAGKSSATTFLDTGKNIGRASGSYIDDEDVVVVP